MLRRLSIPLRNGAKVLLRLVLLILVALTPAAGAHAGALWFADAQGLHRVDTATNAIAQSVPQKGVVALALNQKDNTLWALTPGQLIQYEAGGAVRLQIKLDSLGNNVPAARKLVLNPGDDSVWIAGNNRLLHLDALGNFLAGFVAPTVIEEIALAQDGALWVLGGSKLSRFAPSGLLGSADVSADLQLPNAQESGNANNAGGDLQQSFLAVDDANGLLWLGRDKRLVQIALALPIQRRLSLATDEVIRAVALVPDSGALWISGSTSLFGYSKIGTLVGETRLATLNVSGPRALVASAPSQSLWLGHESGISRFSTSGQFVVTLPASGRVGAISVAQSDTAPPAIIPTVTLVAPADRTLTGNAFTPIVLHLDALCSGQPCGFPPSAFAAYVVTATLNGRPLDGFSFDAATRNTVHTPTTRHAEGVNTLSAYVTDGDGRRSRVLGAQFTVDSIAPRFLTLAPPDGSVFASPAVTLQGSVDDPTARVLLESFSGATFGGTNPAGQSFSYPITLKPGTNSFRITATDPAGNATPVSFTYTYSTLTLAITAPVGGAVIDDNKVTVTGTFSGATNPAILVNGVAAVVSGNGFTAADVPLRFGANTITVSGTAPSGATDSKSLTVTSTFPSIAITSPSNGASISGDSVLVTGQVQAAGNVGVTVNGVIAIVDANSNFYANNVPLQPGGNTLTATVTTLTGKSSTGSVTVTSSGPSPIQITADPIQGLAPLTVAFTVDDRAGGTLASYQFNPGGPGNAAANPDPKVLFAFTYTQPGTYQALVSVTDTTGIAYTQTLVIQVQDAAQMDQMFKAIWNGMNNALIAGDKATAMNYLNAAAKEKYGPVFDKLLPYMPAIVASYSPPQRVTISQRIGEYAINRTINGINRIFFIYFVQDEHGAWLIDAM